MLRLPAEGVRLPVFAAAVKLSARPAATKIATARSEGRRDVIEGGRTSACHRLADTSRDGDGSVSTDPRAITSAEPGAESLLRYGWPFTEQGVWPCIGRTSVIGGTAQRHS